GAELSRQIILVPVLRAGLGMLDAFLEIIPNAIICHVGTERQEEPPFQNIPYYNRLPEKIDDEMIVIVLENMVATGKSVGGVAEHARQRGARDILAASWVAAPEGIDYLEKARSPIKLLTTAAVDRCLNPTGYICPGLGDAGDRINGTQPRICAGV
ncbi:MAG: uracil phosphoribosyltransferase, partial [Candidatus Doudnabacteria bacterium]|nr:uracil phosphoribosyltransferase [Candidatus Doudnabacteria bacterium]